MKAIERLAIVICAAKILQLTISMSSGYIQDLLTDHYGFKDFELRYWVWHFPETVLSLMVCFLVAGWIYKDAPRHRIPRPVWVTLAFISGMWGLGLYLLRVLIAKYEMGQQPHPTCAGCGYDLQGNQSGVCPECGLPTLVPGRSGGQNLG